VRSANRAGGAEFGKAQTVVDGDTIKLDVTTYRIWGIDSAETKQACGDGWMAGKEATTAMLDLVRGRPIACEAKAKDRYGRTVALCRADGRDLGAAMVSAGMAWAFTRYSSAMLPRSGPRSAPGSACTRTTARSLGTGGRGTGATGE
jgi:endonuclease YncB( thermonuclease family)